MLTTNLLTETLAIVLKFCGQNQIEFCIKTKGDKNSVDIITDPIKQFVITIVDDKDENLINLIENKFEELQEFFK